MAPVYNLKKSLLFLLAGLSFTHAAEAAKIYSRANASIKISNLVSNISDNGGGQLVACKVNGKVKYQSLELYQTGADFNLKPNLTEGSTYLEKIDAVLNRFEKVAPVRASLYREWVRELTREQMNVRTGVQIPQSFNEGQGSVLLPKGDCSLVQVAYQQRQDERTFFGHEKMLEVDGDLFNQLDEANKAAVILSSVIYFEARAILNHPDARYARYMSAIVMSDVLKTKADYEQVVKRLNESTQPLTNAQIKIKRMTSEAEFGLGIQCLSYPLAEGTREFCVVPANIPTTYRCKVNGEELEVRNFVSKLSSAGIYVGQRSDKDVAAVTIEESYRADVSLKVNGQETNPFRRGWFDLLIEKKGDKPLSCYEASSY